LSGAGVLQASSAVQLATTPSQRLKRGKEMIACQREPGRKRACGDGETVKVELQRRVRQAL